MRILGLDYGENRIGVAVSDELGFTAQGLETYTRRGRRADLNYLAAKAGSYGVELIVVGLPLNMNGSRGPAVEAAEGFGRALSQRAGLPVAFVDERLTTTAAERELKSLDMSRRRRKMVIDRTAAAFILQVYLDRKQDRASAPAEREK